MAERAAGPTLDTSDCLAAIALAERVLAGQVPEDGPFKLIGVANLLKGAPPPSGASVWQLTFKPKGLLPPSGRVGAGGEWIVRIDLASAKNPVSLKRED